MRKNSILLVLFILISIGCQKPKEKETRFNLDNYIDLEFVKFEQAGKSLLLPKIKLAEIEDSIGTKINKNPRRYEYLLQNRLDADSILRVLPDTIKAKSVYNSLLKDKDFQDYFYSTYYNNEGNDKRFSQEELMKIASKFFLKEKMGNHFRTRICVGINGLEQVQYENKDYTLLEALVYEAICERLTQENAEKPTFLQNLDAYSSEAISSLNGTVKDSLAFVRASVFDAMENDKDLKVYLLSYFANNKENMAIQLVE